jgi:hypothetical protein
MADGQVPRKCGISRREVGGDDECMTHPIRITAEDIAKASALDPKLVPADTEPGLYQCSEPVHKVLLPIMDERLRKTLIPEPLPPRIAKQLGRNYEMIPLIPDGGSISHHDRM